MQDLTFLGLSKKENDVYLALLGLGIATAKELHAVPSLIGRLYTT